MSRLLWACLLSLPLTVIPSPTWAGDHACADGHCGHLHALLHHEHCHHCFGHLHSCLAQLHGHFYHDHAPSVPQAGPWYLYWPYEAHFQVPAPVPYPYYQPTMTLPAGFQAAPPPNPAVGYDTHGAPGYWVPH